MSELVVKTKFATKKAGENYATYNPQPLLPILPAWNTSVSPNVKAQKYCLHGLGSANVKPPWREQAGTPPNHQHTGALGQVLLELAVMGSDVSTL